MFTNRGLMRCRADRVPVGVLLERAPTGRRSQYEVLGLALPVRWSDGYFFFESLDPPAAPVTDPVSDVLEATARAELEQETPPGGEGLDDDYDARLRVFRQIVARRGQPDSAPTFWPHTRAGAPSPGATRPRPWKLPTCARTGDRTPMMSPTGCCCGPTFTPCWIFACWLPTRRRGSSWSPSCSLEPSTRHSRTASSLTRQQQASDQTRPP